MLFITKEEALAIHAASIKRFGGTLGLRDEGALESALAAAENREHYEQPNLGVCAATYAYHLSQAHAFIDGNKRVAAALTEILIEVNDARLNATNDEIVELFLSIAASLRTRSEVEEWFEPKVLS